MESENPAWAPVAGPQWQSGGRSDGAGTIPGRWEELERGGRLGAGISRTGLCSVQHRGIYCGPESCQDKDGHSSPEGLASNFQDPKSSKVMMRDSSPSWPWH